MNPTVEEITARVRRLSGPQQEEALAYVRALEQTPKTPLAAFAGSISAVDLAAMRTVIEADCERIDAGSW